MTATRMEMVLEASERLAILERKGLDSRVRRDFEDGRVAFLAAKPSPAITTMLNEDPKRIAVALASVEKTEGAVAYLASALDTTADSWICALVVRPDTTLWPHERDMLEKGFQVVCSTHVSRPEKRLHSVSVTVADSGAVALSDISEKVEAHWKKRMGR